MLLLWSFLEKYSWVWVSLDLLQGDLILPNIHPLVLDWGQRIYKDVPNEDKGAIFSHTFKRGVTCLHLNHFMQVH